MSSEPVKKAQMAHAQKRKNTKLDFERDVVYENLASIGAQKQQEAEKQTETEVTVLKTMQRQTAIQCYEKTTTGLEDVSFPGLNLRNMITETNIRESLIQTGIGLSPMITMRELTPKCNNNIRKAFALCRDHIVVITIVEAWARYSHDHRLQAEAYTYYTHDGKVMFTLGGKESNDPGQILLGRFLCDDALSIEEEIRLLFHLDQVYTEPQKKDHFVKVMDCLFKSRFITGPYILLSQLEAKNAAAIVDYALINLEKIITNVVQNETELYDILEPDLKTLLSSDQRGKKQSFGRRSRKATSLFI